MRIIPPAAAALFFCFPCLSTSLAGQSVLSSPHDFSSSAFSGVSGAPASSPSYADACGACHALPTTRGRVDGTPASVRYTMYGSSSLDAQPAGQPNGPSLACLTCHDGTMGLDVHSAANLGWDLSNDHPISMTYDPVADASLRSVDEVRALGLRLFQDQDFLTVECGSCHDPHNTAATPALLRVENQGSRLCKGCHIK